MVGSNVVAAVVSPRRAGSVGVIDGPLGAVRRAGAARRAVSADLRCVPVPVPAGVGDGDACCPCPCACGVRVPAFCMPGGTASVGGVVSFGGVVSRGGSRGDCGSGVLSLLAPPLLLAPPPRTRDAMMGLCVVRSIFSASL